MHIQLQLLQCSSHFCVFVCRFSRVIVLIISRLIFAALLTLLSLQTLTILILMVNYLVSTWSVPLIWNRYPFAFLFSRRCSATKTWEIAKIVIFNQALLPTYSINGNLFRQFRSNCIVELSTFQEENTLNERST